MDVLPFPVYGYVYGLPPAELERIAYYFSFRYADCRDVAAYLAPLGGEASVEGWRHAWQVWCQQRSLPGSEVEACRLEPAGQCEQLAM